AEECIRGMILPRTALHRWRQHADGRDGRPAATRRTEGCGADEERLAAAVAGDAADHHGAAQPLCPLPGAALDDRFAHSLRRTMAGAAFPIRTNRGIKRTVLSR